VEDVIEHVPVGSEPRRVARDCDKHSVS
jgi:hypothetical protein